MSATRGSRRPAAVVLPVMINPPFGCRAKAAMARSISSVARRVLIEVNSTPADDADDWIAPHCPLPAASRICGIAEYSHSFHPGRDLLEQLQPFRPKPILECSKSGRVTARSCKAIYDPSANRIGDLREHHRNSPTFLLQRVCSLAGNRQCDVGCKCN